MYYLIATRKVPLAGTNKMAGYIKLFRSPKQGLCTELSKRGLNNLARIKVEPDSLVHYPKLLVLLGLSCLFLPMSSEVTVLAFLKPGTANSLQN